MKKIALLVALSMLLLSAMAIPALAQDDWDVGVEVGDWFLYKGTLISYDSETVDFPPTYLQYLQTYDESDWMNYTVTDINGDVVTFEVVIKWLNGSETTSTLADDMTSSTELMVIGANLPNGTQIRPEYYILEWYMPARYLNDSILLDTGIGIREMNVLDHDSDIYEQIYHYTYYWDKATGIRVYGEDYGDEVLNENMEEFSYRCKLELIDSSMGAMIPEFTGPFTLLALIAITIPIVLLHRRKKSLI